MIGSYGFEINVLMMYHPMVIGLTEDEFGMSTMGKLELSIVKNSLGKSGTLTFDMKESGRIGDG